MAVVSLTSAVPADAAAKFTWGTAGAAIAAGECVYRASDNTIKVADAGASTTAGAIGIAMNAAASGQPVSYLTEGNLTTNAALTAGEAFFLNTTAGDIGLYADLTGGTDYITYIGTASTTSNLIVQVHASAQQLHA